MKNIHLPVMAWMLINQKATSNHDGSISACCLHANSEGFVTVHLKNIRGGTGWAEWKRQTGKHGESYFGHT